MSSELRWWQSAVFYQIYPRSFADGNGDGIGDLVGMINKLDYLQSLGIGALWLSPHYPSPQVDCGYDISDYQAVAPEYGTLDEFKRFLAEAHRRGLRVVLDLVLNHTSDQHPWFQESRSSKDNPKRDWYIWRPGKDGHAPNNWYSTFGGPAWELDPLTEEYYYHFFFKEQPDLNWSNPEVKAAMFDMVRFWLEMGVDGFRLDAIGTIFEDPDWPDQPVKQTLEELLALRYMAKTDTERAEAARLLDEMFQYQHDYPGVHELMRELRALVDEYGDRVLIGETDDLAFYGNGEDELHLNFNFPLMRTERMNPIHVSQNQTERLSKLPSGAWPCNTLGNHDSPRMLNRFGDGKHDPQIARANLMLLLSLKGTPFLYNGEEIGTRDIEYLRPDQYRDPLSTMAYELALRLTGVSEEEAARFGCREGRDKNRTPNQWANAANAGFCPIGVTPWLPVNADFAEGVNVADQEHPTDSMLNFYRLAIQTRNRCDALVAGEYELILAVSNLLVFERSFNGQAILCAFNMGAEAHKYQLPRSDKTYRMLLSSSGGHERRRLNTGWIKLAPFEACWIEAQA